MTILSELTSKKPNPAPPCLLMSSSTSRFSAREGEDALLVVQKAPGSGPIIHISWARGSRQLVGERYRMGENNNTVHLNLQGITKEDEGEYTVTAKNIAGESRSAVQLRVKDNFEEDDTPIFLRRLNDLSVKVGTRTRFLVEIRSSSDIKVTWYRNDLPISEEDRFHFLHEGNFFGVDVAPVTVEDGGRWACVAQNPAGRSSCSCRLNVLIPKAYKAPEFLEELKAILTNQGTVSLECKVVGVPTPVLKWFKDGKELKAGDVFALTANPDDPTSLGTYTCEAANCMGKTYSSSRVHIMGKGSREGSLKPADYPPLNGPPPHFSQELKNERVKIGCGVTLSCQVAVPPWPRSIQWYNKEGKVESNQKYHIIEDGLGGYSIEVCPLEACDEGEWKCVAMSDAGVVGITQCTVFMSYPKNYRKPKFLESLKAILTEEGLVSFECKVVGFPTPQLKWFKDGQELRPGDVYQLTGTNSLGSYSCVAKNCMGEAKSTAQLTVEDIQGQLNDEEKLLLFSKNQPPRFIRGLKSCEAKINEDFRFTAQVTIVPEPSMAWYKDDEKIEKTDRFAILREDLGTCHLDIKKLEITDQAEWKCVATNDFGQSVTSGFLKLTIPKHYKKPRFLECLRAILTEEGAVNLECKVIGVPQPSLKWYKDGKELKPGDIHKIISGQDGTCCLGTYTCEAHNCMGTVSSSASLLGFEDRMAIKESAIYKPELPYNLAKNTSLSTINEERTSQLYDTPMSERSTTMDERGEVSFSFDGKEVSISLYETPDLTEDEALQVVEMYAEELSEHVSEQNVVELPPLRFTKESSKSGPLLIEAVVIDITPEYFSSAEEDLRTEADFEDVSMSEETSHAVQSPTTVEDEAFYEKINTDFLKQTLVGQSNSKKPSQEKSSESDKDSYKSLSDHRKEDISIPDVSTGDSFGSAKPEVDRRDSKKRVKKDEQKIKKIRSRSGSANPNEAFDENVEEGVVTVVPKRKSVSRSSSDGSSDKPAKKKSKSAPNSKSTEQDTMFADVLKKRKPESDDETKQTKRKARTSSESTEETLNEAEKQKPSNSKSVEKENVVPKAPARKKKTTTGSFSDNKKEEETSGMGTKSSLTSEYKKVEKEMEVKSSSSTSGIRKKQSSGSPSVDTEEELKLDGNLKKKKIARSRSSSTDKSQKLKEEKTLKETAEFQIESKEMGMTESKPKASLVLLKNLKLTLQDVQTSLKNVIEEIRNKCAEESLSPTVDFKVFSKPAKEIQKSLSTLEEALNEKAEVPSVATLQSIDRPFQDLRTGLKLIDERKQSTETSETLELFSLVLNHLQNQLGDMRASKEPDAKRAFEMLSSLAQPIDNLNEAIDKVKGVLAQSSRPDKPQVSVELLRILAQPVQELKQCIETTEQEEAIGRRSSKVSLTEPINNLRSAVVLLQQYTGKERLEDSVSKNILQRLTEPLDKILRSVQQESKPSEMVKNLSNPIETLHKELAKLVQETLFPPLKSQSPFSKSPSALQKISQSIATILINLTEAEHDIPVTVKRKGQIFSPIFEPLTAFKTAIDQIKSTDNEGIQSDLLNSHLQKLGNQLFNIERNLETIPEEVKNEINQENLIQNVKEIRKEILEVYQDIQIGVESNWNSLLNSLQKLNLTLSWTKPRPLLKKNSTSLGKSLEMIRQSSEEHSLTEVKTEELRMSLAVLRPLEKPLQDLEEGFGLLVKHMLEKERLADEEKPAMEGQLHGLLEILSQSFESFQEVWVQIDGSEKSDATLQEANTLLKLVKELHDGANTIKFQLGDFESALPETSDIIRRNIHLNMKNLTASIAEVEKTIRKESLESVPDLKALKTTVENLQDQISSSKTESKTREEAKILEQILGTTFRLIENLENLKYRSASEEPPIWDQVVKKSIQEFQQQLSELEANIKTSTNLKENTVMRGALELAGKLQKCKQLRVKSLPQVTFLLDEFRNHIKELHSEKTKPKTKVPEKFLQIVEKNLAAVQSVQNFQPEIKEALSKPLINIQNILFQMSEADVKYVKLLLQPLEHIQQALEVAQQTGILTLVVPAEEVQKAVKKFETEYTTKQTSDSLKTLVETLQHLSSSLTQILPAHVLRQVVDLIKINLILVEKKDDVNKPEIIQSLRQFQANLEEIENSEQLSEATIKGLRYLAEPLKSLKKGLLMYEIIPPQSTKELEVDAKVATSLMEVQKGITAVQKQVVLEISKSEREPKRALLKLIQPLEQMEVSLSQTLETEKGPLLERQETLFKIINLVERDIDAATKIQVFQAEDKLSESLKALKDKLVEVTNLEKADKEMVKILRNLAKPLQELQRELETIEHLTLESHGEVSTKSLSAIAGPLMKVHQQIASIETQVILHSSQSNQTPNLTRQTLQEFVEPLHGLQMALLHVLQTPKTSQKLTSLVTPITHNLTEYIMGTEASMEATKNDSFHAQETVLREMVEPLNKLQTGIAEMLKPMETPLKLTISKLPADEKIPEILNLAETSVASLETKRVLITEMKKSITQPLKSIDAKIAEITSMKIPDVRIVAVLESLAKSMQVLHEGLDCVQSTMIETVGEIQLKTILTALTVSIKEIENCIAEVKSIQEQTVLKLSQTKAIEETQEALQQLVEPLKKLKTGLYQVLETKETVSELKTEETQKKKLKEVINLLETNISTLTKIEIKQPQVTLGLTEPLKKLKVKLADVSEREKPNQNTISMLENLVKPLQILKIGLESAEKLQQSEIINAFAAPLLVAKQRIAGIREQRATEIGDFKAQNETKGLEEVVECLEQLQGALTKILKRTVALKLQPIVVLDKIQAAALQHPDIAKELTEPLETLKSQLEKLEKAKLTKDLNTALKEDVIKQLENLQKSLESIGEFKKKPIASGISVPLQEIEQGIATIQEQIVLESEKKEGSSDNCVKVLKAIKVPLIQVAKIRETAKKLKPFELPKSDTFKEVIQQVAKNLAVVEQSAVFTAAEKQLIKESLKVLQVNLEESGLDEKSAITTENILKQLKELEKNLEIEKEISEPLKQIQEVIAEVRTKPTSQAIALLAKPLPLQTGLSQTVCTDEATEELIPIKTSTHTEIVSENKKNLVSSKKQDVLEETEEKVKLLEPLRLLQAKLVEVAKDDDTANVKASTQESLQKLESDLSLLPEKTETVGELKVEETQKKKTKEVINLLEVNAASVYKIDGIEPEEKSGIINLINALRDEIVEVTLGDKATKNIIIALENMAKPQEELEKGLEITEHIQGETVTDKSFSVVSAKANILIEVQKGLATLQKQTICEIEKTMTAEEKKLLRRVVMLLEELQVKLSEITQKIKLTEELKLSSPETAKLLKVLHAAEINVAALKKKEVLASKDQKNLTESLKALKAIVTEIKTQKVDITIFEGLINPLKEIQKGAEIAQKIIDESANVLKKLEAMKALDISFLKAAKGIAIIEEQTALELSKLSEKTNEESKVLKKVLEPLNKVKQCLTNVLKPKPLQEVAKLAKINADLIEGIEGLHLSMKTLVEPLKKAESKLQEILIDETSEQVEILMQDLLVKPLKNLQKSLETLQKEKIETVKDLETSPASAALVMSLVEMQKGIKSVEDEINKPKAKGKILEAILPSLKGLKEGLSQIIKYEKGASLLQKSYKGIENAPDGFESEKEQLKELSCPLVNLERALENLAAVEKSKSLKCFKASLTDFSETLNKVEEEIQKGAKTEKLGTLSQPISNIRKNAAALEESSFIQEGLESLSDSYLLKTLAEELHELQYAVSVIQAYPSSGVTDSAQKTPTEEKAIVKPEEQATILIKTADEELSDPQKDMKDTSEIKSTEKKDKLKKHHKATKQKEKEETANAEEERKNKEEEEERLRQEAEEKKKKEEKEERLKKEAEEKKKKEEEEERLRQEADEEKKKEEEKERRGKEAEEKKKKEEEEERMKKEAEEKKKREEEKERLGKEAEEKKKKEEEEERMKKEAEEKKKKEEEERLGKEAEEKKKKEEEEERMKKEAEKKKNKKEEEERMKKEAEEKKKREEEKERLGKEAKEKKKKEEEEERMKKEAEEKKKKEEEEERLRQEAEEKKKREEEKERLGKEAEEKKKKEEEERLGEEAEEKKKKEEEEERMKKEAEEKKKKEEEERLGKEAEEKKKKEEEEERMKKEAEKKKKKEEEEERMKKEAEEKKKREAEEKERLGKEAEEEKKKEEEKERLGKEAKEKKKKEEEEERMKKEAEEKKKKEEEEERLRQEADEEKKKEEEKERLGKEAEEKKKKEEEEERMKKEAEEKKNKKEEEERMKKEAEEKKKRKEEKERLGKEAEEKKKKEEEEERMKKEAEEKKKKEEEEERMKKEAEEKKKKEEEERLGEEAEEKKKKEEEEERMKKEAEEKKNKKEEEERMKKEAEEKKKREAEEKERLGKEAEEEKKKEEEEERMKKEAEEKKKKEEEERLGKEAEEKTKKEEEERLGKEAEEKKNKEEEEERMKKEAEEKKKKEEEEERMKKEAEEKKKKEEEEERLRQEAEEKKKREEEEERMKKEAEEKKKKEEEERLGKEAEEKKKKEEEEERLKKEAEVKKKKEEEERFRRVAEEGGTVNEIISKNQIVEREVDEREVIGSQKITSAGGMINVGRERIEQVHFSMMESEERTIKPGKMEKYEHLSNMNVEKSILANEEKLVKETERNANNVNCLKEFEELNRNLLEADTYNRSVVNRMQYFSFPSKTDDANFGKQRLRKQQWEEREQYFGEYTECVRERRIVNEIPEVRERYVSRSIKSLGGAYRSTESLNDAYRLNEGERNRYKSTESLRDTHRFLNNLRNQWQSYEELKDIKRIFPETSGNLRSVIPTWDERQIKSDISLGRYNLKEEKERKKKPSFCTRLLDRTASQGSTVKLTYAVLSHTESSIQWLKDGTPIFIKSTDFSGRYRSKLQDGIASLEILNVGPGDSGEYTCLTQNSEGEVAITSALKVYGGYEPAPFPPTFTRPIREFYKSTEDELTMECRVRSQPNSRVVWMKNGLPIRASSRYHIEERKDGLCSLTLYHPEADDSGEYTCRAENAIASSSSSHYLNFSGRQQMLDSMLTERKSEERGLQEHQKPQFHLGLADSHVSIGGTIALQVELRGTPREVKWLRGGEELPRISWKIRSFEDSGIYTLLVSDASEKEAGTYTCRAYSSHGDVETSAAVQVMPISVIRDGKPPKIISRPNTMMTVNVEDDIIFTCRVVGQPKPKVACLKGVKDITVSERTMLEHSDDYYKFSLKRVVPADAGTYWIIAKNMHGSDRAFITVQIKQRARSLTPDQFSSFRWNWGSNITDNTQEIRNLKDRRDNYQVKETPGPIPKEPFVIDSGRNWLTLSWSKPINRGAAPVLAYRVDIWQVDQDGGARWTEIGVSPVNSFDVFNLNQGIDYKFRITPRNRYGWGEPLVTLTPISLGNKIINIPEFVKILPGQLKALWGSEIELECQVISDVIPSITWYRDGIPIDFQNTEKFKSKFDGRNCFLKIENLKEQDSGRYMCEAVNRVGRVSTFARLMVVNDPKIWKADTHLKRKMFEEGAIESFPPQFTMRLRDRRVQMTYPVRLTCQVFGCPLPIVTWYKDGDELVEDERHAFTGEDHFYTLEISKTILEDSGCYKATAKNESGSVSCHCNLVVDKGIRAYVAPDFVTELAERRTVKYGEELRLAAQVEAYPSVGVVWHRNGVRLRPSRRIIMTLDHDGTVELAIAGITQRESGAYTCTATNEVGRCVTTCKVTVVSESSSLVPQIQELQLPYSKAPMFITKPRSSEAIEGDTVIIDCEVVGDPKPEIFWFRDFLKPDYYRDSPHFRRQGEGPSFRLEIPHAKLDFTGTYSVVARNVHGEAKAVISLQIYAKGQGKEDRMDHSPVTHGNVETLPVFQKGLKDLRCCDGDAVTLECVVSSATIAEIRWEKGGRLLPLNNDFVASFDGKTATLTIKQVYPEDEGEYTCIASNEIGRTSTSACLIVDVPEEKENLLSRQLTRPCGLMSGGSTPRSTPRTTPSRSISPYPSDYGWKESSNSFTRQKRLKVAPPKFYAVPHNRIAEEGENVRFQCAVAGHPTPWVTWDKDNVVVTPSARISIKEKEDMKVLEIEGVTIEDAGLYRVTIENEVGRVEATARLDVIGKRGFTAKALNMRSWSASPTFRRRLTGSIGRIGGNVTLACDIKASPTPVTSWYRNGELVVRTERINPTWNGRAAVLKIEKLELNDAGVYTCMAENAFGKCYCSAELTVLDNDDIEVSPPVFVQPLKDVSVEEGTPAELQVRIKGSFPLDVVWVKDNREIPNCLYFCYIDYGDGRFGLRIADVFAQDSGEYICEVFNQHGEAVSSAQLLVKEPVTTQLPKIEFSKKPTSVIVPNGRSASFCCRLQHQTLDTPPILVEWEVGERIIEPDNFSSKFSVEENGDVNILLIASVDGNDAGKITCTKCSVKPYNLDSCNCKQTFSSCSAELTVIPTNIHNNWTSDSECDCTNLKRPRSRSLSTSEIETDFPKMLKNVPKYTTDNSSSEKSRALIVRGPSDANVFRGDKVVLRATYCGKPEPQVRWLKGGRVLENNEKVAIITGDGATSLSFNCISTDDSGKYVVCIENEFGTDCHFAFVAVEGPPDPPASYPLVTSIGNNSVEVEWSSPAFDGGSKITGYVVEMKNSSQDKWTGISGLCHSLSYTAKNLQPNTKYRFRVRAENIHGQSEPSYESNEIAVLFDSSDIDSEIEYRIVTVEDSEVFKAKYEVLEELGKGRYGIVHKVSDLETGQKMAAKFIRCIKIKDKEKVKEEIEIMNSLRHPKLLRLAAAFESPREIVMVMEYISGGELFERVVADDFQLTERDCILFMRQICEGVKYMHKNSIVHLDLKPENIMCQSRTSHEIKLIDFGLARKLDPDKPVRVLFGTPEFVPPEIINYEPIGFESDMWSVGVICYVLLSGLSPFMGENDAETFANITRSSYDFDDEAFNAISKDAKDFISSLLVKRKEKRLTASECLKNKWMMSEDDKTMGVILSTDKLKKFIIRRKWQKTGNAIRALGRMATLSAASRKNSQSSKPAINVLAETTETTDEWGNKSSPNKSCPHKSATDKLKIIEMIKEEQIKENNFYDEKDHPKVCSERSDSGISDCSSVGSGSHPVTCPCSNAPLLSKKYSITEEDELKSCKTEITTERSVSSLLETKSKLPIEVIGTKVDNIRKKFANLSKNIDEMDKKLENVGKKLVDIGPGKITTAKKSEIKRVPSLKDHKNPEVKKSHLMQHTASSQAKITITLKQPLTPTKTTSSLMIPISPELRMTKLSKNKISVRCNQSSASSPTAKSKLPESIKSIWSNADSGHRVKAQPSVKIQRLQQMYNTKTAAVSKESLPKMGLQKKRKDVADLPKVIHGRQTNFQETVAFWKR